MKRLIFGGLSVLLMTTAIAPAVRAEMLRNDGRQMDRTESRSSIRQQITPFDLVYAGYRGEFSDYGIPGYITFMSDYRWGRFDAEDLVKIAIQANRLSPQTLSDEGYINAVDAQLNALFDNHG